MQLATQREVIVSEASGGHAAHEFVASPDGPVRTAQRRR